MKYKFLIILLLITACSPYQSEYKDEVVISFKQLTDIPEGIDESGEITLKSIEFHCELAVEGIADYLADDLTVSDFIEFHYATFRMLADNKPIQDIETFMTALYKYCNLEEEFNSGWTTVEELEKIYIADWKQ